jgi:hypothetical protein
VRSLFGHHIPKDAPSFFTKIRFVSDREFNLRYIANRGGLRPGKVRGFTTMDSAGNPEAIYVRRSLTGRQLVETVAHEAVHWFTHPNFGSGLRIAEEDGAHWFTWRVLASENEVAAGFKTRFQKEQQRLRMGYVHGNMPNLNGANKFNTFLQAYGEDKIAAAFFGGRGVNDLVMHARRVYRGGSGKAPRRLLPQAAASRPVELHGAGYTDKGWRGFYQRLAEGREWFPTERHIYVVQVPDGPQAITFDPSDVVHHGTIAAGASSITWDGVAPANPGNAQPFGTPPAGMKYHVIVTDGAANVAGSTKPLKFVSQPVIPFPAEGVAATQWKTFNSRVKAGKVSFESDRYITVVQVPRGNKLRFRPSNIVAIGILRAGDRNIHFPRANVQGATLNDAFGPPKKGHKFMFFVTKRDPPVLRHASALLQVSDYPARLPSKNVAPASAGVTAGARLDGSTSEVYPPELWNWVQGGIRGPYVVPHPALCLCGSLQGCGRQERRSGDVRRSGCRGLRSFAPRRA